MFSCFPAIELTRAWIPVFVSTDVTKGEKKLIRLLFYSFPLSRLTLNTSQVQKYYSSCLKLLPELLKVPSLSCSHALLLNCTLAQNLLNPFQNFKNLLNPVSHPSVTMASLSLILLAAMLALVSCEDPLGPTEAVVPVPVQQPKSVDYVQVKLAAHEHTEEQQRAIELAKMEQMRKELSLAPPSAFGLPTPVVKEPEYGSDLAVAEPRYTMGNQLPMDDQWNPVVQKAEPPVQKVVPIQTPTVKVITHEDKPAASDLAPASDRSEDIYQMSMGMQTTTAGADAVVKNVMRGLTVAASFLALIVA
jgi:hypothetical protein